MSTKIAIFVFSFFVPIFIYFNLVAINQKYVGTYSVLTYLPAQELKFIYFVPLSAWDNQQKM